MTASRPGVTLLELLVVLVIVAMAASLAVPAFTTRTASENERTFREIASALRLARERAIGSGASVEMTVDPTRGQIWVTPRDTSFFVVIPSTCRLEGPPRTTVRFAPDGTARGELPSFRCERRRTQLVLDALTGTVRPVAL